LKGASSSTPLNLVTRQARLFAAASRALVKKPDALLGLVDPVFEQACGCDIADVITQPLFIRGFPSTTELDRTDVEEISGGRDAFLLRSRAHIENAR
jgi:hypothetical protein